MSPASYAPQHDESHVVPGVPGDEQPGVPPGPQLPRPGGAEELDGLSVFSRSHDQGRSDWWRSAGDIG